MMSTEIRIRRAVRRTVYAAGPILKVIGVVAFLVFGAVAAYAINFGG